MTYEVNTRLPLPNLSPSWGTSCQCLKRNKWILLMYWNRINWKWSIQVTCLGCVLCRTEGSLLQCRIFGHIRLPEHTGHTGADLCLRFQTPLYSLERYLVHLCRCQSRHTTWTKITRKFPLSLIPRPIIRRKVSELLSPSTQHRCPDAEDSASTSQIRDQLPFNVIKCVVDRVQHTCCKMNIKH